MQGNVQFEPIEVVPLPAEMVLIDPIQEIPIPTITIRPLSERLPNIDTVFYAWYIDELWNYKGSDKNERSFLKNTVSTLIIYMKLFLPANCYTLLEKPSENDVERRRLWVADLRKLCLSLKERVMGFIQTYHTTIKHQALRQSVLDKAKTHATRKYLREIPVDHFPPMVVDDRITQSTVYVYNNVDLQHFHNN